MEHPARACLAEILVTAADRPTLRGSGYLVAPGWVLTAAHVVHGARSVRVWLGAPTQLLTGDGHSVDPASVRTVADTDLALVPISADATPPGYVRPLLGVLDRDDAAETGAVAVGFPWFKLRPAPDRPGNNLREVRYAVGRIVGGSNAKTGTLEFGVTDAPDRRPDPDASPWEGMSGGPLFTHGHLVGVVGQHHPTEGMGTLTARPLRLPDDVAAKLGLPADQIRQEWKDLLPQLAEQLPVVTPPTLRELSSRRAQAAAGRLLPADGVLIAREDELAELAAFATGTQRWRWIRAEAFAGKTALLAYFALHPPEGVDPVACFLRSTTGENTAAHALKVLNEQLAGLHGVRISYQAPPTVPDLWFDFVDNLLPAAAKAARQAGRPLLVVIDGLDEYDPVETLTLNTWLPDTLPEGVSLLVASRSGLPIDLPEGHPLASPDTQHRIGASEVASQVQQLALNELQAALRQAGELTYEVAACLAATGGGISLTDLNAWLIRRGTRRPEDSSSYLADQIRIWFHRSVHTVDDPDSTEQEFLEFAHDTLQHAYQDKFANSLAGLRNELHDWAQHYQQDRWPHDTPSFLLTGYPRLLASLGETERLTRLALDTNRHNPLRTLTGADAAAVQQIRAAQELNLNRPEIDLLTHGRLAIHRTRLETRAGRIPVRLPAVWALLDRPARALATATAMADTDHRAGALTALAEALTTTGEYGWAGQAVDALTDPGYKTEALSGLVGVVVTAGTPQQAREVAAHARRAADDMTHPDHKAAALTHLVDALIAAGELEQTRKVAQQVLPVAERALRVDAAFPWSHDVGVTLRGLTGSLTDTKEYELAQQVANTNTDPSDKAEALLVVAKALKTAGDYPQTNQVVQDAREVAETIRHEGPRTRALAGLVEMLAAAGDHKQARQVAAQAREAADAIAHPDHKAAALTHLADALIAAGYHEEAHQVTTQVLDVASTITSRTLVQAQLLIDLVRVLAAAGYHEEARQVTARVLDVASTVTGRIDVQAQLLIDLVRVLAAAGDHEEARQVAAQARQAADAIAHPDHKAAALTHLADALIAAGYHEEAHQVTTQVLDVASTITSRTDVQAQLLIDLVRVLAAAGDHKQARQVAAQASQAADAIANPDHKAAALTHLADALIAAGERGEAHQAAEHAQHVAETPILPAANARLVTDLVEALTTVGATAAAREVATAARDLTDAIPDAIDRAVAMTGVARALASVGATEQAREVAMEARDATYALPDRIDRDVVLPGLAEALAAVGIFRLAYQVANLITEPYDQAVALIGVARALATVGATEQARQVTQVARDAAEAADADSDVQAKLLSELAQVLGIVGDYEQACDLVNSITYRFFDTAETLTVIAETLVLVGSPEDAYPFVNAMTGPHSRARVLAGLARALTAKSAREQARQVAEHALRAAETMTNPGEKAQVLTDLAGTLTAARERDRARRVAEQARQAAETMTNDWEQVPVLIELADVLIAAGDPEQARQVAEHARQVAETIVDPDDQALPLAGLAGVLTAVGDPANARKVATQVCDLVDSLSGLTFGAFVLTRLIEALAVAGDPDLARQVAEHALRVVETMSDKGDRARAMTDLVKALVAGGLSDLAGRRLAEAWVSEPWLASIDVLAILNPAILISLAEEETRLWSLVDG